MGGILRSHGVDLLDVWMHGQGTTEVLYSLLCGVDVPRDLLVREPKLLAGKKNVP